MFTQEQIDGFKEDLQTWFDDYVEDGKTGEWESQLKTVFTAGYGQDYESVTP